MYGGLADGDYTRGDRSSTRAGRRRGDGETGASAEELREAWGCLHVDEALMSAGRPLPGTRIGRLIEMLDPNEDEA